MDERTTNYRLEYNEKSQLVVFPSTEPTDDTNEHAYCHGNPTEP